MGISRYELCEINLEFIEINSKHFYLNHAKMGVVLLKCNTCFHMCFYSIRTQYRHYQVPTALLQIFCKIIFNSKDIVKHRSRIQFREDLKDHKLG